MFSAEDPDSLRGPQFEAAWADELAKWKHVEETWDMLQFGLRLGAHPRQMVTTTPRPIPLLKRFLADPQVAVSRVRTADNAENLAPAFLDTVVGRYAGTRLGRQELDGDIIEDRPDALWTRDMIEANRTDARAAARAHRRRRRSARLLLEARGCLRHRRGGRGRGRHRLCAGGCDRIRTEAARMGGEGGGALSAARRPMRSSSRRTRAARWRPA